MKKILQRKRGKDQLVCMTQTGPVRKRRERDGERGKREEGGFPKSGLRTQCYSFVNSQKYKKDLSVYNALKSHRRKKEMNSTHLLSGLPLKEKKAGR